MDVHHKHEATQHQRFDGNRLLAEILSARRQPPELKREPMSSGLWLFNLIVGLLLIWAAICTAYLHVWEGLKEAQIQTVAVVSTEHAFYRWSGYHRVSPA